MNRWCAMRASSVLGCVAVLGTIFCILGVLTVVFFDDLVSIFIHKEMVLCDTCETYEMWQAPPVQPMTKVYFFNVTNPDEVMFEGAKPVLQEVGPFTYAEEWQRVNLTWDKENHTVSYYFQKIFHFRRDLSVADDGTIITTANTPLLTAMHGFRHGKNFMRKALGSIAKTLKIELLTRKSVRDLMWGYNDPLIDLAVDTMPEAAPFEKFGYFYGKNGTDKDRFTMYTGEGDISRYSLLKAVNGESMLDKWSAPSCNMINGSDGSGFPPGTTKSSTLYMFQPQMCRSIPMVYDGEVTHDGILAYRFTPPENVFGTVEENPDNACFCLDPPDCADHGLFNASLCMFGAPILLSWPHFYNTDSKYLEAVEGLSPNKSLHQFYMDIEPRVSMSLQARVRIQINIVIKRMEDVDLFKGVSDVVLPALWFQTGVERMPDKILNLIRQAAVMPGVAEAGATYSLFILGGIMVLGVVFYIIHKRTSKRNSKVELNAMTTNGIHNMTMELNNSTRTTPNHIYPDGKPGLD